MYSDKGKRISLIYFLLEISTICTVIYFFRAEGRVLVFQYRKSPFSSEAERDLDAGVRAIAAQNKVIP